MGFLDKVKKATENTIKGALQMAATSYGIVGDGKYKGSKVCMNTDNDTLVFTLVAAEQGRHIIKEDIKCFDIQNNNELYYITLYFNDGETSKIICKQDEKQGSALNNANNRLAAQYKNINHLVSYLARYTKYANEETKKQIALIASYCGN